MDTFNRLLWVLMGLVVFAIGATEIVVGLGALGSSLSRSSPVPAAVAEHVNAPTGGDLLGLAVAGLLAALVGLLLLRAELRVGAGSRLANLRFGQANAEAQQQKGHTVVRGGGLEHGVQQSLQALRGVHTAHVRLGGNPSHPALFIELDVDQRTSLSALKTAVQQAIRQFRRTSGTLSSAEIRVSLAASRGSVS